MAPWALRSHRLDNGFLGYGLSVVCVALALALALAFQHYGFREAEAPLFELAIVVTAWYAGLRPSALAVILSALCFDFFFTEPLYKFGASTTDLAHYFVFTAWAGIVASFVTVRRRIEGNLRQARDQLQREVDERAQRTRLLDQTHDSIIFRKLNGLITYWNRGAQELYGWRAEEAVGKVSHQFLRTIFPAPIEEIDGQLLKTGVWEGELKHIKADGSEVIVASRWSLSRDPQGQPTIMETNNDITDRKRREEEIRELNQELEKRAAELDASNKELESFAYSVSHDLRAPLRHLVGYSELLQKQTSSSLDEKSQRYVQHLLDSSKKMGNLIDDLLAFSRIGRAETRTTVVNLGQLVEEVAAELAQEIGERDIAWKINPLPACYGDRSMLKLVIVNLLSNAIKFTRSRQRAAIEIGCVDVGQNYAEVFVKDNGAGFEMEYVDKLFGVFQRLHLAEEFEGTGIGLATVQRIIHRHGGKVRAEGAVDQGATFYFSLPKAQVAAERMAKIA